MVWNCRGLALKNVQIGQWVKHNKKLLYQIEQGLIMVDMLVGLGLKHEVIDAILVLNRSSSERELDRKNEKSGLCPFMRKDGLILVQMRCYT